MAPELYWREFTRDGSVDRDFLADENFLIANFSDWFGRWLQEGDHAKLQSFDSLVRHFWDGKISEPSKYDVDTFMVADGSFFTEDQPRPEWFTPHVRFLTVVKPAGTESFARKTSPEDDKWTFAIAGSSHIKQDKRQHTYTREHSFLDVASWDGVTVRYYKNDYVNGKDKQTWIYFGESMDAFGKSEYLGPFNGHVNGAPIMKELHEPWIHWLGQSGTFEACFSIEMKEDFKSAPYLSRNRVLLSEVNHNPEQLEDAIKGSVSNFFITRRDRDFKEASKLRKKPQHIPRWTAHVFLTTTVNIVAALPVPGSDTEFVIPNEHFFDKEVLRRDRFSDLYPTPAPQFKFTKDQYQKAAERLGLCLVQRVDPTKAGYDMRLPSAKAFGIDKRETGALEDVFVKVVLENSEGLAPFVVLHTSFEDAQGMDKMQTLAGKAGKFVGLFSKETLWAIMMVDFWNPIYSWRRLVLMKYVPRETELNEKDQRYDLEARFIANVEKSSNAQSKTVDSPEYQFLQLLKRSLTQHQDDVTAYIEAINTRMTEEPEQALEDYLALAESRRRIYRPLPLDEFGFTLPFARNIKLDTPLREMTKEGRIQNVPKRGVDSLTEWATKLASVDPVILPPANSIPSWGAPLPIYDLPRPALLSIPCQSLSNLGETSGASGAVAVTNGCPYVSRRRPAQESGGSESLDSAVAYSLQATNVVRTPNWTDDILPLINAPYWVSGNQKEKGARWIEAMYDYGKWYLNSYNDVKGKALSVYRHLRSKSMPITRDPQDYWPEEALELFRTWANAGFPETGADAASPETVIPRPLQPAPTYLVRKDIMSLSKAELALYQSKLDDILQVGSLGSKWQELGLIHADWCLHYQEATFLWHRAHLRYVETLIGFPIPYWNGYSKGSAEAGSGYAGIPPMFFEEKYVHPVDGSTRPNPLKYALAFNGKSKGGEPPEKSAFVTRWPHTSPEAPDFGRHVKLFEGYHAQITAALKQGTFTSGGTAQGFGFPWANIQTFSYRQDDKLYPYRHDFDGLFEQVHDNFHGWVGPDMADNTYTAFDPIFLSYHANMDRLAAMFMEAHPDNQFTSNFPLQPFINQGTTGIDISYDDPRRWSYTTIGDMAKDTRALGYMYGLPADPDVFVLEPSAVSNKPKASGGRAITLPPPPPPVTVAAENVNVNVKVSLPIVVFEDVGCTDNTYRIDVFTPDAEDTGDASAGNPDFIGQVTRLGMGPGTGTGRGPNGGRRRCRKPEATRILSAGHVADKLKPRSARVPDDGDAETPAVKIAVTDLHDGRRLGESEYKKMPGFEPKVIWLAG